MKLLSAHWVVLVSKTGEQGFFYIKHRMSMRKQGVRCLKTMTENRGLRKVSVAEGVGKWEHSAKSVGWHGEQEEGYTGLHAIYLLFWRSCIESSASRPAGTVPEMYNQLTFEHLQPAPGVAQSVEAVCTNMYMSSEMLLTCRMERTEGKVLSIPTPVQWHAVYSWWKWNIVEWRSRWHRFTSKGVRL